MQPKHLRIAIVGWPVNEYQITDNRLEVRMVDFNGRPFQRMAKAHCKRISYLHFRLNKVVAHWFLEKTAEWELPKAA